MADYFAMNHDELTAEKTALEAQYLSLIHI